MFKMLIDTCVWLDIAKDYTQKAVLGTVEKLIKQGELVLLVPQTIVDEFARNKARVIEDSNRSLGSYLKRVKEAIDKLGDPKGKAAIMDAYPVVPGWPRYGMLVRVSRRWDGY